MSRLFWQGLQVSPGVVSVVFLLSNPAIAQELSTVDSFSLTEEKGQLSLSESSRSSLKTTSSANPTDNLLEQIDQYSQINLSLQQSDPLERINSVNELSDVRPTDWAYSALRGLAERYGCLLGYRDGTYRGNRAMTRYEFAAGLDECMNVMQRLIEDATSEIGSGDLDVLRRLQEEFAAELATLRARVDGLEVRTAELEANQFSTTTKLQGEILFALSDTFGNGILGSDRSETTFAHRTRLNFETSFTGEDRLRTRLQMANMPGLRRGVTATNMTRLSFDTNTDNEVEIGELWYRFPISDKVTVQIDATEVEVYDSLFDPYSPLESSGGGSISRFGRFNPIYRQNSGGPGINVDFKASDRFGVTLGYIALNGEEPTLKRGIFNGANAFYGQVNIAPADRVGLGLLYVRSYYPGGEVNLTGSTGSSLASNPFGDVATTANSFGAQGVLEISPNINLSGWFGWIGANAQNNGTGVQEGDDATIVNWAVALTFPDLGKKGSVGSILVGSPPKVTDNDSTFGDNQETSLHIEAAYRYRLTSKIEVTPGFYVLTKPEHEDNSAIWVGTLRTRFRF